MIYTILARETALPFFLIFGLIEVPFGKRATWVALQHLNEEALQGFEVDISRRNYEQENPLKDNIIFNIPLN